MKDEHWIIFAVVVGVLVGILAYNVGHNVGNNQGKKYARENPTIVYQDKYAPPAASTATSVLYEIGQYIPDTEENKDIKAALTTSYLYISNMSEKFRADHEIKKLFIKEKGDD